MNEDEALSARLQLGTAFDEKPETVQVRARGGDSMSSWVGVPVNVFRQMLGAIRGNEVGKALPQMFMGGEVVMAARIPVKAGHEKRHQAIIVREYTEDGRTLYSVHYILAQRNTDEWHADLSDYGIQSREEAFDEFHERMHKRGGLSRDRKVND